MVIHPIAPQTGDPLFTTSSYESAVTAVDALAGAGFPVEQATNRGAGAAPIVAALGGMQHYSWVATSAFLTSTVSIPLAGKLSDVYGRRLVYATGLAVFVGGSLLSAAAQTFWWLVAARGVQGVGIGATLRCRRSCRRHHVSARARPLPGSISSAAAAAPRTSARRAIASASSKVRVLPIPGGPS